MSDTPKKPTEIPENIQENIVDIVEEGARLVKDGLKKLVAEIKRFDEKHAENRRRLKHGSRRRTTGRIV
jgi:hypothetical protein